jgi:hypothetical protein
LGNTTARYLSAPDYPEGYPPETAELLVETLRQVWGTPEGLSVNQPSKADDEAFARWYPKWMRAAANPREFARLMAEALKQDVRHVLPLISVPTLVLHRTASSIVGVEQGRYIAEHIPGATLVELPGRDASFFWESADEVLDRVEEFLTGARQVVEADRVLAAVLFTDIVGSTERAVALGDRRWKEKLQGHDVITRSVIEQYRGRVVKTTGDGVLATFEGPGRAIRCAFALQDALRALDIEIRAGLHTGEVEPSG